MCNLKKYKGSSRRIYSCFFTHNGITTPKTTREGQESTTKISLHLAWPPKFKNQVLFTPRAQNRFLDLGLLLRGCRPKSRSLPGRVEVIQPVVRACTERSGLLLRGLLWRGYTGYRVRHIFCSWRKCQTSCKRAFPRTVFNALNIWNTWVQHVVVQKCWMIWKSLDCLRQMKIVFLDKCLEAKCREKPGTWSPGSNQSEV